MEERKNELEKFLAKHPDAVTNAVQLKMKRLALKCFEAEYKELMEKEKNSNSSGWMNNSFYYANSYLKRQPTEKETALIKKLRVKRNLYDNENENETNSEKLSKLYRKFQDFLWDDERGALEGEIEQLVERYQGHDDDY